MSVLMDVVVSKVVKFRLRLVSYHEQKAALV
jgi:hypothetical protein